MKNLLQITSAGEDLLGTVDDGTNRLFINDTEIASSQWTGTGSYTGSFSGHTITIAKIADTSGNVAIRKTGDYAYQLYDQKVNEYLPLTGGTLTGNLYMPNGYALAPDGATFDKLITGLDFGQYKNAPSGLPLVSYSQLNVSSSANIEIYAQAWLKYICANYAHLINTGVTSGSWSAIRPIVTMINPNDVRIVVGFIYNPTDLINGYPRYASFRILNRTNTGNYKFGTENGAWWFKDETGIGSTYSTRPAAVSCANATITKVATLTIPAGTWWIRGVGNWSTNTSGYRTISFENSVNGSRDLANSTSGTSGTSTFQEVSYSATYSSSTTLNLYGWQNSGGVLNVWPYIEAMRIA